MEISRLKPLYTREDIRKRVEQLGEQITKKYGDEPLVVVCVLKGAFIFFADLVRCIDNKNMIVDFVRLSSYGNGGLPGFVMDDGFIVGYGLDYAEKLRTLPDICIPDEN